MKSLRIVYFALATGVLLFVIVSLLINSLNGAFLRNNENPTEKAPFVIALVVLTGIIFFAHKTIITKKLKIIQALPSLEIKLIAWRELYILQGALIEAPSFMAIVLFMILGFHILLVWPLAGIAIFWFSQPDNEKFKEQAKLTTSEIDEYNIMS